MLTKIMARHLYTIQVYKKGAKEVAELLLANKAEINAKAGDGATPLHWAALDGCKEVAELLPAARES